MKLEYFQISDELFLRLGTLITERFGIRMPLDKKIMFQARLQRRLHELRINSFDEYAQMILKSSFDSQELSVLADLISTNKTEFFREKDHFEYLSAKILPEYLENKDGWKLRRLNLWSAGCSSGMEAYSLAITLEEFARLKHCQLDYSILATDISVRMLKAAKDAIYPNQTIAAIPLEMKQRYFLKSKDLKYPKVRLIKAIREKVSPAYLNLMDTEYLMNDRFDIVFLRNTLIYFMSDVQRTVLVKVLNSLKTGGYLFIGHSESLINMNLPIRSVAPSIYVKINI